MKRLLSLLSVALLLSTTNLWATEQDLSEYVHLVDNKQMNNGLVEAMSFLGEFSDSDAEVATPEEAAKHEEEEQERNAKEAVLKVKAEQFLATLADPLVANHPHPTDISTRGPFKHRNYERERRLHNIVREQAALLKESLADGLNENTIAHLQVLAGALRYGNEYSKLARLLGGALSGEGRSDGEIWSDPRDSRKFDEIITKLTPYLPEIFTTHPYLQLHRGLAHDLVAHTLPQRSLRPFHIKDAINDYSNVTNHVNNPANSPLIADRASRLYLEGRYYSPDQGNALKKLAPLPERTVGLRDHFALASKKAFLKYNWLPTVLAIIALLSKLSKSGWLDNRLEKTKHTLTDAGNDVRTQFALDDKAEVTPALADTLATRENITDVQKALLGTFRLAHSGHSNAQTWHTWATRGQYGSILAALAALWWNYRSLPARN